MAYESNLCTNADSLSEIQHVVDALKINGYTEQFIRSCQSTTTNQFQTNRGFVTLPYLQGISEKIARALNHFNIIVAHKPVMTVGSILKKPKDKFSKDLLKRVSILKQTKHLRRQRRTDPKHSS